MYAADEWQGIKMNSKRRVISRLCAFFLSGLMVVQSSFPAAAEPSGEDPSSSPDPTAEVTSLKDSGTETPPSTIDAETYGAGAVPANVLSGSTTVSSSLRDYVTDVSIQNVEKEGDSYALVAGKPYEFSISFAEIAQQESMSGRQFDMDHDLTYQLPFRPAASSEGSCSFELRRSDGSSFTVAVPYTVSSTGLMTFSWPKNDPNFEEMKGFTNLQFRVLVSGIVNKGVESIDFGNGQTVKVTVQDPPAPEAEAHKSHTFDKNKKEVTYTVVVTAHGDNTEITGADTILGSALSIDGEITTTKTPESSQAQIRVEKDNTNTGFSYTISSLKDGETVTFTYTCKVDPAKLADGKGTWDTARNTFTYNGKTTEDTAWDIDYQPKFLKSGEVAKDKKTITWTATYNKGSGVSVAGNTITDTCGQFLTFPDPFQPKVTVTTQDGTTVDTNGWHWQFKRSEDGKTWTCTIPEEDQSYVYTFQYVTNVDTDSMVSPLVPNNTIHDDKNHSTTGTAEEIPVPEGSSIGVTKTVKSTSAKIIQWQVTLDVPAKGLDKAIVTDTFPNQWINGTNLYEPIDASSIQIDGMRDGESYEYAASPDNKTGTITFYKDKNHTPGLQGSAAGRKLVITYETGVNQDWLNQATEDWQKDRTNKVTFTGNSTEVSAEAKTKVTKQELSKLGESVATNGLPVYCFYVIFSGNTEKDQITIKDTPDNRLVYVSKAEMVDNNSPYHVSDSDQWKIQDADSVYPAQGLNYPWRVNNKPEKDGKPSITSNDGTYTFQIDKNDLPRDAKNDSLYPYYALKYCMAVKDADALKELETEAAKNGGSVKLNNRASAFGIEATSTVSFDYGVIKKQAIGVTKDDAQKISYVSYSIVINPDALDLNPNGDTIELRDELDQNQAFDLDSFQVKDGTGQEVKFTYDSAGNTAVLTVPDQKNLTVSYRTRVIAVSSQSSIEVSNTARLGTCAQTVKTNAEVYASAAGGGNKFLEKIIKYQEGDMSRRLPGAVFHLEMLNGINWAPATVSTDSSSTEKQTCYFVTNEKGEAVVSEDSCFVKNEKGSYHFAKDSGYAHPNFSLVRNIQYRLVEDEAPKGYEKKDQGVTFKIGSRTDSDPEDILYLPNGGNIPVANSPSPLQATLTAQKVLHGGELKDGMFSFNLLDQNHQVLQTKTNDAQGKITFDPLTFTDSGTYVYQVQEVIPENPSENMVYDHSLYQVTYTIAQYANGTLYIAKADIQKVSGNQSQSVNFIVFDNYNVQPVTVQLSGTKNFPLLPSSLKETQFKIRITETDATWQPLPGGFQQETNVKGYAGANSYSFELTYQQAGTHYYAIEEIAPKGVDQDRMDASGIVYDATNYKEVVTVTRNAETNALQAEVSGDAKQDQINFYNQYRNYSTSVQFSGTKKLHKKDSTEELPLKDWNFQFDLKKDDSEKPIQTTVAKADGTYAFDSITFDKNDLNQTYTYFICERKGLSRAIIYDPTVYKMEVKLVENATKTGMDPVIKYYKKSDNGWEEAADLTASTLNFTNTYEEPVANISFAGTKTVSGDTMPEFIQKYSYQITLKEVFGLSQTNSKWNYTSSRQLASVKVKDKDSFSLGPVRFTGKDVGTHFYEVDEVSRSADHVPQEDQGISFDKRTYLIEVEVKEGQNDAITANVVAVFYKGTSWDGAGNDQSNVPASIINKTATQDGKNVTVQGLDFINSYKTPDSAVVHLKGKKTLEGASLLNRQFHFILKGVDEVSQKALDNAAFSLTSADDPDGHWQKVRNKENGSYRSYIRVSNSLAEGDNIDFGILRLSAGEQPVTYSFTVQEEAQDAYPSGGESYSVIVKVRNVSGKAVASVSGLSSTSTVENNVQEIDGLNFTNKSLTTSVPVGGTKLYAGETHTDTFTFALQQVDEKQNPLSKETTVKCTTGETCNFGFTDLLFTSNDIGKAYRYKISEKAGTTPGVTYDDSYYILAIDNIHVQKTENGSQLALDQHLLHYHSNEDPKPVEKVEFDNSYHEAVVPLSGRKTLYGQKLNAGMFSFKLAADSNNPDGFSMPEDTTVTNQEDGTFAFAPIVFTSAGEYQFTVKENVKENDQAFYQRSPADGYKVKVTVTKHDDGSLSASTSITNLKTNQNVSELNFKNMYQPKPVQLTLHGTKILTNTGEGGNLNLNKNQYQFSMTPEDPNMSAVTAGNEADGTITFGPIEFKAAGTYHYRIQERQGTDKKVIYDPAIYSVDVDVVLEDNQLRMDAVQVNNKKLTPVNGSIENAFTFHNKIAETTDVSVTKIWYTDKDISLPSIEDAKSWFHLYAGNQEVKDSDGESYVPEISASASDDHSWTITYSSLPKKDRFGNDIVYSVKETIPADAGFEAIVDEAVPGGVIYNTSQTTISGQKTWNWGKGKELNKKLQPQSVTVRLFANGMFMKETTAALESGWEYKFTDLPQYDRDGKEIKYSVDESPIAYFDAENDGYDLKNSYAPKGSAVLKVKKLLDGSTPGKGAYRFVLSDSDGKTVAEAVNDENGEAAFVLYYVAADIGSTYTYTIREYVPEDTGNVEYDTHTVTATVKVDADADTLGALDIAVRYSGNRTFKNATKPTETPKVTPPTPKPSTPPVITPPDRRQRIPKTEAGEK
jgi:pilin isopeptide linkage protein